MDVSEASVFRFDDGKAPDAMRTIGEVSAAMRIKPHVLRYWEAQFPMLQPLKRSGGRRLYRPADITLLERIDTLVNRQGYTLKGARMALQESRAPEADASREPDGDVLTVARPSEEAFQQRDNAALLARLHAIRDRLAGALDG